MEVEEEGSSESFSITDAIIASTLEGTIDCCFGTKSKKIADNSVAIIIVVAVFTSSCSCTDPDVPI